MGDHLTGLGPEPLFYTPREAGHVLGKSHDAIRAGCERGEYPAILDGKSWKISRDLLRAQFNERCMDEMNARAEEAAE
jgi:hypothetical protein